MRFLRWLLVAIAGLGGILLMVAVAARFADGPIGPFPGGKLSGVRATEPVSDWTAVLAGVPRIELEVSPEHPRSVTTSYLLHDGTLYVPSMFAARKSWPQQVLADGRVVLRIGGKLYEGRAVRVTDPAEVDPLVRSFDQSAAPASDPTTLSTWYFRIDPRR